SGAQVNTGNGVREDTGSPPVTPPQPLPLHPNDKNAPSRLSRLGGSSRKGADARWGRGQLVRRRRVNRITPRPRNIAAMMPAGTMSAGPVAASTSLVGVPGDTPPGSVGTAGGHPTCESR